MLNNRDKGIVLQIISHCNRIIEKVINVDKSEFESNLDYIEVVCFNLFQIGELAKKYH